MGEVYRARDARLKRHVALKVLPEPHRFDARRMARLEQEAQALAAVNHPNIATLYGIEEGHGLQALVMELVEGETLADRLAIAGRARGSGLPVAEAVTIARQVTDALEAAHARGIVHRDLKPANIKVRADGTVKVLDFGLASAGDFELDSDLSLATATTSTAWGPAAGTPAYMSPEQARGGPVDRRADIWAFGCVLYEMLAGKRAFAGDTASDVIARVIEREPDFAALPPGTTPSLRRLLRRTLVKDAHHRLHDIADARLELLDADGVDAASLPVSGGPVTTRRSRRGPLAAALFLAIAGLSWMTLRGAPDVPARVSRFEIVPPASAPLRDGGDETRLFAVSPDGTRVAYLTTKGLAVRTLDHLDVDVLDAPNIGFFPFFSPDSKWIAGTLDGVNKVSVAGGPVIRLADTAAGAIGAWGDDGIVFADVNGLFRVSAEGGTPERLPLGALGPSEQVTFPEPLPGRRAVLFTVISTKSNTLGDSATSSTARIEALDLDSGARTVIVRGGGRPRFLPSGRLLYASGEHLFIVRFDPARLTAVGEPVQLGDGSAEFGASNDGTLVYGVGLGRGRRELVWVDRRGREQPVGAPVAAYAYPRISPDGARVALDVPGPNRDIWMWDIRRQVMERFTDDPTENVLPAWSPDGKYLAFTSGLSGVPNMFLQATDGSGVAAQLLTSPLLQQAVSFAPDGRVIFTESVPGHGRDIKALQLSTKTVEALVQAPGEQLSPEVSLDRRWIAYASDETGQFEIYVRPYAAPDSGRWKVSINGGRAPLWSRDGRELFYRDFGGALLSVPVAAGRVFVPGPAMTIIPPSRRYAGFGSAVGARSYDVSPDGSRFLMIKNLDGSAQPSFVVVQNWLAEVADRLRPR
jgi:eukaryotic-like serine/threonine-protein kinase